MLFNKNKIRDYYMDIEACVSNIKADPSNKNIEELRDSLNKYFYESECLKLLYTNNSDKMFFGVYAMPIIDADKVIDMITKDNRYVVKKYYLELDSKLFGAELQLTIPEITAVIIHDISHIVNDSVPSEVVKNELDKYLTDNKECIKISDSVHYRELLSYGFRDAMRKITTLFEKDVYEPEGITDEFIDWCNYSDYLKSALSKVNRYGYTSLVDTKGNKFIMLSWIMRLYKDIARNRIPAIKSLERGIELTASQIEKKEFKDIIKRLNRIDDDQLLESFDLELLNKIRYENDLVDKRTGFISLETAESVVDNLKLLTENCHQENEKSDILHSVNNKMNIIQDYVDNTDMTKNEFKQWNKIYKDLSTMRNDLNKDTLFHNNRAMCRKYMKLEDF